MSFLFVLAGLLMVSLVSAQEVRLAQFQRLTINAPTQIVLRLDGVQGSSTVSGHEGWIDATAWGFGVDAGTEATGQIRTGPAQVRELVVIKRVDRATPKLFDWCVSAANIPSGELKVPLQGGSLRIEFNDARVLSLGHDPTAPDATTERVTFAARRYTITVETPGGNYETTWSAGRE